MGSPLGEGAAAIIFDPTGRVLLVKENYDRRRWGLPGGLIEPGETPEEAALRETTEETGVAAAIDHRIGSYTFEDGFRAHVFRCRIVRGEPAVPTNGEIAEVRWASPEPLPSTRSNVLHYALPDAMQGLPMSSAPIFP
jgi:8-oxo-dGTP pyrophosphatase MutT (NUDIX family)